MGGGAAAVPEKKHRADVKRFINFSIPQKFDFSFFMIILIFLAFGLVMLFSCVGLLIFSMVSLFLLSFWKFLGRVFLAGSARIK